MDFGKQHIIHPGDLCSSGDRAGHDIFSRAFHRPGN